MNIWVNCPACQVMQEVPDLVLGHQMPCAICGQSFLATTPASDSDDTRAAAGTLQGQSPIVPDQESDSVSDRRAVEETRRDNEVAVAKGYSPKESPDRTPASVGYIGRFQIRALLGEGGFGRVYRSYDPQLDREVALKVPRLGPDAPRQVERFLGEARAAARLRHPHIVAVFESGQAGDDFYIAAEFVEGMTLAARLTEKRLKPEQAAQWVRDIALALAYAHGEGIVHRDVKPANIMIDKRGRPQLMDFGLAKRAADLAATTTEGTILGTPAYMAPEQARGDLRAIGPHSDQYSLGAVLYELLTGRRPFEGSPHVVLAQAANPGIEPRPPRRIRRKIPRDLEVICLKAMAKDPARRYESAGDFAVDLQLWLKGEPIHARPSGPLDHAWRWIRRHPLLAGVSGVAAATAVLAAVLGIWFAIYYANASRDLLEKQQQTERALAAAQSAEGKAQAEKQQAQLALGNLHREQGIRRCEQGNAGQGLLLLAKSAELAHAVHDQPTLRNLQANIAFFAGQLVPLRGVIPLNGGDLQGACAFSPDGKRIVTASRDVCQQWDANTYKSVGPPMRHVREVPQMKPGTGVPVGTLITTKTTVHSVAYSPDGKSLVVGSLFAPVQLWDSATGAPRGPSLPDTSSDLAQFSPDGRWVVTIGKEARLWDADTGEPLGKAIHNPRYFRAAAFSVDGKQLLLGAADRTARLWDPFTGEPSSPGLLHAQEVTSVALHPDGKTALTCSGNAARLWNLETGAPVGVPFIHDDFVTVARFSPDGALVVTGSNDGTARVWDTATGQPRAQPLQGMDAVRHLAVRADGRLLLASDGQSVRVWDLSRLAWQGRVLRHNDDVSAASFTPNGQYVLSVSKDEARLWNARTGEPVNPGLRHGERISGYEFSPDGKVLAAISEMEDRHSEVRLWNLETRRLIGDAIRRQDKSWSNFKIAFSPDSRKVMTFGYQAAQLWDVASGKAIGPLHNYEQDVLSVVFNSDSTLVLTSDAARLDLIDAQTGRSLSSKPLKVDGGGRAFFAPDGKTVLVDSPSGPQLWFAATGFPVRLPLKFPGKKPKVLAIRPDHRVVLIGDDGQARLCDSFLGKALGEPLSQASVWSAAFSPNGKVLLTGLGTGQVQLWNPDTGKALGLPVRHAGTLDQILFSSDGSRVLTRWDKVVGLWDSATGQRIGEALSHDDDVTSLAFAPDGRTILTCTKDTAQVWDTATGKSLGLPMPYQSGRSRPTFGPDGQSILTVASKEVRLWATPTAHVGGTDNLSAWLQVMTGMELGADGKFHVLDATAWEARRNAMK